MTNGLSLIRDHVGQGKIISFIENEIGITYRTFVHQCNNDNLTIGTIYIMIDKLGIEFSDFKVSIRSQSSAADKAADRKATEAIKQLEIPLPQKLSDLFR